MLLEDPVGERVPATVGANAAGEYGVSWPWRTVTGIGTAPSRSNVGWRGPIS